MGVRVREKPKGSGVWFIFINHQGKRKSKKIGNDEKLAREVAEKVKAKLVLGELNVEKINEKGVLFKEYAEMWLALPHDIKESTKDVYKGYLKRHIYPVIGKMEVNEIRKRDLKLLFDKLSIQGFNPENLRAPLRNVFNHAVESELIDINPLNGLKFTKKKEARVEPLKEHEIPLLLDETKKYKKGKFYPATLCLLRTGLRLGELHALTWADIDFEERLIDVTKTLDQKGRVTKPKNNEPRKVDMTPLLTDVLRELKSKQWKEAVKRDQPIPQQIFYLPPTTYRYELKNCLEAVGLRHIRIHDLRHTYATIRLLRGHNIQDVCFQLGHSDISITYKVYTHWIPGKFKSEVDELDTHPTAPYTHLEKIEKEG